MTLLRGLRNVGLVYIVATVALFAFGWRGAVTFGIGVCVGFLLGHRAGRREATFEAARDIARSRPERTFELLDGGR